MDHLRAMISSLPVMTSCDDFVSHMVNYSRAQGTSYTKVVGDLFEAYCSHYLKFSGIATDAWLTTQVPEEHVKSLNISSKDQGQDIVYINKSGVGIVQCKFRVDTYRMLTKEDNIDSFLTLVGALLASGKPMAPSILMTNVRREALPQQQWFELWKPYIWILCYEDLMVTSIINSFIQSNHRSIVITLPPPRPVQIQALTAMRDSATGGIVQMMCGTGKTLLMVYGIYHFGYRTIVLLEPTLRLLEQNLHVLESSLAALGIVLPIHNASSSEGNVVNGGSIRMFLDTHSSYIIGATYKSASYLFQQLQRTDVLFCDESHHLANKPRVNVTISKQGYNKSYTVSCLGVDASKFARRFHLTATPVVTENEAHTSMDDAELFGPVLFRYGLTKAIADKYLCDYKIMSLLVKDEDVPPEDTSNTEDTVNVPLRRCKNYLHARILAGLLNSGIINRCFVFTSSDDIISSIMGYLKPLIDSSIYVGKITSHVSKRDRKHAEESYNRYSRAVLFSIHIFKEGVDIPSTDSVYYACAVSKSTQVLQSLCRCLRSHPDKTVANVILPVILDQNEGSYQTQYDFLMELAQYDENVRYEVLGGSSVVKTKLHTMVMDTRLSRSGGSSSQEPVDYKPLIDQFYEGLRLKVVDRLGLNPKFVVSWDTCMLREIIEQQVGGMIIRRNLMAKAPEIYQQLTDAGKVKGGKTPDKTMSAWITNKMCEKKKLLIRVETGRYQLTETLLFPDGLVQMTAEECRPYVLKYKSLMKHYPVATDPETYPRCHHLHQCFINLSGKGTM